MADYGNRLPGSMEDERNNEHKAYGVPKKLLMAGSIIFLILGSVVLYFSVKAHQPLAIALAVMMYVASFGYLLILKYPDRPTHRQRAEAAMKAKEGEGKREYQPPRHPENPKKKKKKR